MRRFGTLVTFLTMAAILSLCLVLPMMADENAPLIITDTPTPSPDVPGAPAIVPEASTLLLLGGSATALAAYVGLQIQARRRKP